MSTEGDEVILIMVDNVVVRYPVVMKEAHCTTLSIKNNYIAPTLLNSTKLHMLLLHEAVHGYQLFIKAVQLKILLKKWICLAKYYMDHNNRIKVFGG